MVVSSNTSIVGDLVVKDGMFGGIHDEPDVAFDTTDFYVGFIGS